ncbi:MAG: hypothetical protein JSV00_10270 [bacterium]|nr:MAG: hypothetical protein JSV00_10270 [bacterium]
MRSDLPLSRIVTHDDLDGVVSAALVSTALGIRRFFFTGPVSIVNGRTPTTEQDVVCDLPCPVRVGMWFDHHPGNLDDLHLRGQDPEQIPGRFAAAPSCARVVYDHFSGKVEFPAHMAATLEGTDRVDSFDYRTMSQWREPRPERKLADSIYAASTDRGAFFPFMEKLVGLLRDGSMEEALEDQEVSAMVLQYGVMEDRSLRLMETDCRFHPDDKAREVVVVDLTRHNRRPDVIRGAAFILNPEALAVLQVTNNFERGRKTNDLSFSMSLSFLMNRVEHGKDIGEIMRSLNIGDGHPGAGAGRMPCRSKDEMLKTKEETIGKIIELWKAMD